jgi:hypothetical protein
VKHEFLTLSEDVRHIGLVAIRHYKDSGHSVAVEPNELGSPGRPALRVRRGNTTTYVLIAVDIAVENVLIWASYAKCLQHDSRVCVIVPKGANVHQERIEAVKGARIGLMTADSQKLTEIFAPIDLTLNAGLPAAANYHKKMRRNVSEIIEKFERGEWQDAMFDAQVFMEARAREWFADGVKSTRIKVLSKSGVDITPAIRKVKKATMGALKEWFLNIQNPNGTDNALAEALTAHNPFRIKNDHDKLNPATQRKLKPRAANLFWVAFDAVNKTYA